MDWMSVCVGVAQRLPRRAAPRNDKRAGKDFSVTAFLRNDKKEEGFLVVLDMV